MGRIHIDAKLGGDFDFFLKFFEIFYFLGLPNI